MKLYKGSFLALLALSVVTLLILDPVVPRCSQEFLQAFSVKAHFIEFGMCISYVFHIHIMQAEVCIDSN